MVQYFHFRILEFPLKVGQVSSFGLCSIYLKLTRLCLTHVQDGHGLENMGHPQILWFVISSQIKIPGSWVIQFYPFLDSLNYRIKLAIYIYEIISCCMSHCIPTIFLLLNIKYHYTPNTSGENGPASLFPIV